MVKAIIGYAKKRGYKHGFPLFAGQEYIDTVMSITFLTGLLMLAFGLLNLVCAQYIK